MAYPPASLATDHVDGVGEVIHAADVNDLAQAVNDIVAVLGGDPTLSFAAFVFDNVESLLYDLAARMAALCVVWWSYTGAFVVGVSDRVYPRGDIWVTDWHVALAVAGSTDTVVRLLRGGVTQATATVPAGDHTVLVDGLAISVAPTQYLQAEIVTVGTGAEGLVARAGWQPSQP